VGLILQTQCGLFLRSHLLYLSQSSNLRRVHGQYLLASLILSRLVLKSIYFNFKVLYVTSSIIVLFCSDWLTAVFFSDVMMTMH